MSRFLESICFDGQGFPLLEYHQRRVDRVFREIYGRPTSLQLTELLLGQSIGDNIHKVRIVYDDQNHVIETIPYERRAIKSLNLVRADSLTYDHKYADRSELQSLFDQRGQADDILIVKNGLLTDCSYANIALYRDQTWYTPANPLLPGVRRAKLLAEKKIVTGSIAVSDLSKFEQLSLFNAMIDLGEVMIDIGSLVNPVEQ